MQGKRAPTLKDIAREAGVGLVTASTVVNASCSGRYVAEATRQRVLEVAERLQYSPNIMARGLKRLRLDTLGISFHSMTPDDVITEPYSAFVLRGIISVAHRAGYNVTLFHKPWRDAKRSATGFRGQGIDGFLIVAPPAESDMASGLAALGIPLIVISAPSDQHGVPSVAIDNATGVRLALDHLFGLGHRRIAHLLHNPIHFDTVVRRETYRKVMEEAGLPVPPEYIREGGIVLTPEDYQERARELLSLPDRPTAIFTTNDWIALQVMEAAQAMGIRVPKDLSVIGFDDIPAAAAATPPLTTIRQPLVEMGQKATRLLISLVESEPLETETHWFTPELILRGTTAPPPYL